MPLILERRRTRAAVWSRRTAGFALVLFATVVLVHRLRLVETPAFLVVLGLVVLLAAAALLFAVRAFVRIWNHADRGGADLMMGAVYTAMVLAPFGVAVFRAATSPMLNDVSTDGQTPPALERPAVGQGIAPLQPWTSERAASQAAAYPAVTGRRYAAAIEQVEAAVDAIVTREGWGRAGPWDRTADDEEATLRAQAWSPWIAMPADVAIRVSDEGDSVFVDMRSASRYGPHDLGDNAARIVSFLTDLDAEMATRPSLPTPAPPSPSPG